MRNAGRCCPALCGLLVVMLGGCAHTYVDAHGQRHIVGFMHLSLPAELAEPKAAEWMRWRTVGLAISSTDISSALEIGYSDNTLAVVQNNSCVALASLPATLFPSFGERHAPASFQR